MSAPTAPGGTTRIADVLPLSPLQSGLFFHAVSGETDVYRSQLALDLTGPLDAPLLRRCADALLDRHTALRTAFVAEETDEPVGVVLDGLRMPWSEADLTGDPRQDAELEALAVRERARPFPLDRAPLIRLTLARLGAERWRLLLTNHHLLFDGWSVPVLLRELFTLYGSGGDPAVLPAVRPYRDHLAWLAAQDEAAARAEWRRALAGLAGPTLVAPGGTGPGQPVRREVTLSPEVSGALAGLARRRGVTLNTVLQTLWALALGTATDGTDIVFGTTVSGRPAQSAGTDRMVGLFANTVPVRVRIDGSETVAELLDRVQREQAALLEAQHLGLAGIQRDAGFAPLFDTLLVFESYPTGQVAEALAGTGLEVRPLPGQDATHFPLVLVAVPGDSLRLVLKYQPRALDAAWIDALAERLPVLAQRMAEGENRRIAALPVLTGAEQEKLRAWNGTGAPVTDATLVDLVAAAVANDPAAVAIRWAGGTLDYRRLDALANDLAHRLRAHGVANEARVGLYLRRSPEFVLAALAVLRAGGAFVPLDPELPQARVRTVAEGSGLVAVCAAQGTAAPELGVPVVAVGLDGPGASRPPAARIDGEQIAYVIHTSGSTGTPKGAMIRHRSIGNRLRWQAELVGFGPGEAALFKAPLGFDISVNEMFLPLTTGATLVIAAPGEERDLEALAGLIARERVSFCYLTSSMLAALLELPGFRGDAGLALRHVWCGGELLTPELFARFRSAVDATMYHGYGPAETTIGVTHEVYEAGRLRDGPTIGRPNPNTRAYVLDAFLRPVPPGVVGELHVGGLLLGRGYAGDPRRTAERFVADPFGGPGERLYRTGDLAAWLPDGRLRFAGRGDNQVKIRGMRVEPEEVESVLAGHPGLGQVAVLTPADPTGGARLVAFCAPKRDAERPPEADEVRRWARTRLAEHLVPAELTILPALPMHDSGKVNRAALAALVGATRVEAVPPRTGTERRLLAEFRTVLGRDDIGVTDDFFAAGGHSLLAIRLAVAVRAALDAPLSVRSLLANPTVAELAAHLDAGGTGTAAGLADTVLLPLRAEGPAEPLFCVHGASGLALNYTGLLGHLPPGRPVYGLQARSLSTDTDLPADLTEMAAQYVEQVRAVQPHGPYHLLGWSLGGTVAHLMACQLRAAGEEVGSLTLLDSFTADRLPGADPAWTLERGLARLLRDMGCPVDGDAVDARRAGELAASGTGSLSGFTADDLCNVVLSWRHSAGLGGPRETPVFDGDLLIFSAAREDRAGEPQPAEIWGPFVTGEVRTHPIDATHPELGRPGPLAEVAARLCRPGA
jgi:amino acid adenylation domain-containing protein